MTRSNEKPRPSVSARVISSSLIKQKQVRKCNRVFKQVFIGESLLYTAASVSAVQQTDPAIRTYRSPLFQVSFPFKSPQFTEKSSQCCTQ